jgi:hypothetical protein
MITVRRADVGDISTIARHRAAMFAAMGVLPTAHTDELVDRTTTTCRTPSRQVSISAGWRLPAPSL